MSWPAYYKRAEFQQVPRRSAEVCIDMITLAPDMKGASSHTSYSSAVSPNHPRAKKYLMEWTTVGCGVLGPPKAVLPFRHHIQCGAAARHAKMQPVSVQDSLLLAFSPALDFLAIGSRDGRVKAFDTGAARTPCRDRMRQFIVG